METHLRLHGCVHGQRGVLDDLDKLRVLLAEHLVRRPEVHLHDSRVVQLLLELNRTAGNHSQWKHTSDRTRAANQRTILPPVQP
jgi:hypothetical protein